MLPIILVAFCIRLAAVPFALTDKLDPARDHWNFGCEEGRIARSIATGHGFSSPLFGDTGPTSWTGPVYPYLLAGVFKVLGVYSRASAWGILALNCVFSAFTCIPVFFIAQRVFGNSAAGWAAWLWALYPYAIYLAVGRIWGYCLDTFLLSLVVWCTFKMEEEVRLSAWVGYGVLWGIAALSNAVMLSTLPFLLAWLVWRRFRRGLEWLLPSTVTVLFLILAVSPWFVRNYVTFGKFIPFRGVFWMVFWESNTGDISDTYPDWTNPAHNDREMEQYRNLGELAYVQSKRVLAMNFLRQHPGLFLRQTVKRIFFTWTGYWSSSPSYLASEPMEIPNVAFSTLLTVLFVAGIRMAWVRRAEGRVPLACVVFSYPLVYYVTHSGIDYRHPLDPTCVVFLGALACDLRVGWAGVGEGSPANASTTLVVDTNSD